MGFLPTGALLKISAEPEIEYRPGRPLVIPVLIHRDGSLNQPLTLTLVADGTESSPFSAVAQGYAPDLTRCEFVIDVKSIDVNRALVASNEYPLTIRATLMKDGKYPVVSETKVIVTLPTTIHQPEVK